MKILSLCLLIVTVYAASAVPVDSNISEDRAKPQLIEFPDGEENIAEVDLEAEPDMELLAKIKRDPSNIKYTLYTRDNPVNGQTLLTNNATNIFYSNFKPADPTVAIVHDWLPMQDSRMNIYLTHIFLTVGSYNVIVMDWRFLANSNYITATNGVSAIGRSLGQFLAFLNQLTGSAISQMHLVGLGLGAHTVGFAGRELEGKVGHLSALNPAGPLWYDNPDRVNSNDAIFVEGIHTDFGLRGYGIGKNVGDSDIYVNGGNTQPGCFTSVCNHNRAWHYFAETLMSNRMLK